MLHNQQIKHCQFQLSALKMRKEKQLKHHKSKHLFLTNNLNLHKKIFLKLLKQKQMHEKQLYQLERINPLHQKNRRKKLTLLFNQKTKKILR